jgi:methylthioribose-1-phosphate isomerase
MKSIEWCGTSVRILDQTRLPLEEIYFQTDDYREIGAAIRALKIRGAPAIGVAAAYGVALAALQSPEKDIHSLRGSTDNVAAFLAETRPTAVNLFWALQRMKSVAASSNTPAELRRNLVDEAVKIHQEDERMCRDIGAHGSSLVPAHASILTHCNTGALATGGEGTAQSVITTAHRQGKSIRVYADETRPLLQGARLTVWELQKAGVDVTLITDSMAAFLMKQKKIDLCIVGADRIAANGDTANKIGTYSVAVNARYHGIPFYVAAPSSTIDCSIASGESIPIEERNAAEITEGFGKPTAPAGTKVYAPAFDVTPASLITAIITERGVFSPPFTFTPDILRATTVQKQ